MGKYEYICSGNITPYKTFNPLEDKQRTYIAIDLKSFYASVECVERGLDPLTTNLVVADASRTEKTICLAVSPSLKQYGIGGRARLFEVVQRLREVNYSRRMALGMRAFEGKSVSDTELKARPELEVDYIAAVPRMAYYIEYSTRIYKIYLKYLSPEDIHVYSIDEVLMDVTDYLTLYHTTAHQLAMTMIRDVLRQTGITATAGIGSNLYLCKVAMDIMAKKQPADKDGVRIAELDETSYRRQLWDHRPLTDFWRVGRGIANQLAAYGIDTMGKVARCSVENEELLYRLFGVNAELLIHLGESASGGAGDGRHEGAGTGGETAGDRPTGADHKLRRREPDQSRHKQKIHGAADHRLLWPHGTQSGTRHSQAEECGVVVESDNRSRDAAV